MNNIRVVEKNNSQLYSILYDLKDKNNKWITHKWGVHKYVFDLLKNLFLNKKENIDNANKIANKIISNYGFSSDKGLMFGIIETLKPLISELNYLRKEFQLRIDHGKEFKTHLIHCNQNEFLFKKEIEKLKKQILELKLQLNELTNYD